MTEPRKRHEWSPRPDWFDWAKVRIAPHILADVVEIGKQTDQKPFEIVQMLCREAIQALRADRNAPTPARHHDPVTLPPFVHRQIKVAA